MTLIKDEKGRLRHEKYRPIPEQIVCSKCGIITSYSHSPLTAIKKEETCTKITKNRKTGEVIGTEKFTKLVKTGEYICEKCA